MPRRRMPPSKRNSKKQSVERFYADKVTEAFTPSAYFLMMGSEAKHQPDVLYGFGKVLLGIEVTGAYYSKEHAEGIHTQARQSKGEQAAAFKFSIAEPDRLIRKEIEASIKKKTKKRYENVDQTWLAIHQQAELSDKASTDLALKQIQIPELHSFKRIFLVHTLPVHDGCGYRVVQFFPSWETYRFKSRSLLAEAILSLEEDGQLDQNKGAKKRS